MATKIQKKRTADLLPGDTILVKTGHKYFGNVGWYPHKVVGVSSGVRQEVSFASGLVCRFLCNTVHTLA